MSALALKTVKERRLERDEPVILHRLLDPRPSERQITDAYALLADYWRMRCCEAEAQLRLITKTLR